jgi:acetyl-CoA C-acetyltransferase
MNDVVIVSGVRTPVGDFLGSLKDLSSVETGALALKAAM